MEGLTEAEKVIVEFAQRTDHLTAIEGVPYVLVSPERNPNMLVIMLEAAMVRLREPVVVLHSGRETLEV